MKSISKHLIFFIFVAILFPKGYFPASTSINLDDENNALVTFPSRHSPEDDNDILSWKIFSRIIHYVRSQGGRENILIKQDEFAGDWLIDKTVRYKGSEKRLVSEYKMTSKGSIIGHGKEIVFKFEDQDINNLNQGKYRFVNKRGLKTSIESSDGTKHNSIWMLTP